MGVFLGQLPPAELARLKAELAETLIANFCYPRFYDYRTQALRMRPVDRSKRQEVWLYLSSVDFMTWNRIELMSPDLQSQIERLFIHFVQRNRAFFGEQGRKRMADVRMLISTSASTVADGLRNHLAGQNTKKSLFGSPRPVPSWSTTNATGRAEPGWEQIAQMTMQLQQSLQEARGEIQPGSASDSWMAAGPGQRTATPALPTPARPVSKPMPRVDGRSTPGTPATGPRVPITTSPPWAPAASAAPGARNAELGTPAPADIPAASVSPAVVNGKPGSSRVAELQPSPAARVAVPDQARIAAPPVSISARVPVVTSPALLGGAATQSENEGITVSNEDITIFEEMRHQLIVWLRIEAVRLGLDISGQSPSQLLELLRQQDGFDQTRLQVVSTLFNLVTQVVKNGKASLFDYKQGLMFHLMHTRRL
ncbi:MAG: hypothetical protein M3Z08_05675 [Chloroflexota bacterium]|nr:hypothetical protein [Chloroflexota bacterium]